MKRILGLAVVAGLLGATPASAQQTQPKMIIKMGTLAPKGSTWMKYLSQVGAEIEKMALSRGRPLEVKYYWGGVQGDEETCVDKMKSGQLDGCILTSVGLAKIVPDALVYQLPFLFENDQELDAVRNNLNPWFETKFASKGYELLGWGDVGYTYFFSKHPIRVPQDLAKGKMWVWSDPMAEAVAEYAGASPKHLGVPDVLPNLTTDFINIVYTSPLAALSLQWANHAKYVESLPWTIGVGASVVRKEIYDIMSAEEKVLFEQVNQEWMPKLLKRTREDNKASVEALKKLGIEIVKITPEEKKEWLKMGQFVEKKVTGSFLSAEVVKKVKDELAKVRVGK